MSASPSFILINTNSNVTSSNKMKEQTQFWKRMKMNPEDDHEVWVWKNIWIRKKGKSWDKMSVYFNLIHELILVMAFNSFPVLILFSRSFFKRKCIFMFHDIVLKGRKEQKIVSRGLTPSLLDSLSLSSDIFLIFFFSHFRNPSRSLNHSYP